MPEVRSAALLRDIELLFSAGSATGFTDRQLLERVGAGRDATTEASLEILVMRHGPMVMRVCRNLLRDQHDANDAFQATFLVMVRRLRSIRHLESVGGWLCAVATRVCARMRVDAARRRVKEERAAVRTPEAPGVEPMRQAENDETTRLIQREVSRLPSRYRDVVVLCFMQGLTQEEAAARLGRPIGTVRSRMARGKELMRKRLARRGIAPMLGVDGLAVLSDAHIASGVLAVSPELVSATVRATMKVITGARVGEAASVVVASLVHQTVWSLTMIKIGGVVAGVMMVGLTGAGVSVVAQRVEERFGDAPPQVQKPNSPVAGAAIPDARTRTDEVAKGSNVQPKPDQSVGPYIVNIQATASDEKPLTIRSEVKGQSEIVKLLHDGAVVKKNDVICELDSTPLQDLLINQRNATTSAQSECDLARLTNQIAALAVRELEEEQIPAEQAEAKAEMTLAESELALATAQSSDATSDPKNVVAIKRSEINISKARLAIQKTHTREVLAHLHQQRTMHELQREAAKAKSNLRAKQANWELEQSRVVKLEMQIAAYTIKAARDGIVLLSSGFSRFSNGNPVVGRGDAVCTIVSPAEYQSIMDQRKKAGGQGMGMGGNIGREGMMGSMMGGGMR